jgi:hypothetical protein
VRREEGVAAGTDQVRAASLDHGLADLEADAAAGS